MFMRKDFFEANAKIASMIILGRSLRNYGHHFLKDIPHEFPMSSADM